MPELLLELFSEEIPARMQEGGAQTLARLLAEALAPLSPDLQTAYGPRRIAAFGTVAPEVAALTREERGPRLGAPEAALAGFLRKHGAARADVVEEGGYHVLRLAVPARPAAAMIAEIMPPLLRRFPWPKSMRWGESAFLWVRPLRRIVCLLDGAVVPFALADGADRAHGLASGNVTEGHRFHAPGGVEVQGVADWREKLRQRKVIVAAEDRKRLIREGLQKLADDTAPDGLSLVDDASLLDEVAGLVEWPVPMLGRIDASFMDLPPEVMQVSMRVNQRYFALREQNLSKAAPFFAFVANIAADDGGKAIIAGNERVLRARFADARHFWDLDRKTPLADRIDDLRRVTFHARLGSQYERARRLARLAGTVGAEIGADPDLSRRAGLLAKADLTTGMVGEFPELQGIIGGYYAKPHEAEDIAFALTHQYAPPGFFTDAEQWPDAPMRVAMAVALADRLDTLCGFFGIGERPTGSGDPFALRRAALVIIGIARALDRPLPLKPLIATAAAPFEQQAAADDVFTFIIDRLRVQLRAEGQRHDALNALFAVAARDDVKWLATRAADLTGILDSDEGRNLVALHRRAANILRIENAKDGPHDAPPDPILFASPEEHDLDRSIARFLPVIATLDDAATDGTAAMQALAGLRAPLDRFFTAVLVNDPARPDLRGNRLRLLNKIVAAIDSIADFSKIEA